MTALPEPVPDWGRDLINQLDCDAPAQAVGGEVGDVAPVLADGTASPYAWLESLVGLDLPLFGWTEEPLTSWFNDQSHWVRNVNVVEGRVKAVLIMGGQSIDGGPGRWDIVGYRACRPDEFDPLRGRTTDDDPWVDADGAPTEAVRTMTGPGHCDWQSTIWLFFGDRLYLRDPLGLFETLEAVPYLPDTTLPRDAAATGLHGVDRELFTTDDDRFVFVRTPDGVERWPLSEMPGCV